MTKRLLLSVFALSLAVSSGCVPFRKSPKPRDPGLASDVEAEFRQRWIDKRAAELVAQGKAEGAARTQAADEFRERFEYLGPAPN